MNNKGQTPLSLATTHLDPETIEAIRAAERQRAEVYSPNSLNNPNNPNSSSKEAACSLAADVYIHLLHIYSYKTLVL